MEWRLYGKVWYAYLVNDSDFLIESVMVVSSIWTDGEMKKHLLRHAFVEVPGFCGENRN
jgi:hypothetical protein